MRASVIALAVLATGCGASNGASPGGECEVALSFSPAMPFAAPGARLRVDALVSEPGVNEYSWSASFEGSSIPFEHALANRSAIELVAETAGVYEVSVHVETYEGVCQARQDIVVRDPNAHQLDVWLRVIPPVDAGAPPSERKVTLFGGTDLPLGQIVLEPGRLVTGSVQSAGAGVPAYLRFVPTGAAGPVVEAFAPDSGQFSVRVLDVDHEVLVIPSGSGLAPTRVTWDPAQPAIAVDAGTALSGHVHHGATPIEGAKVQLLTSAGVPSTIGTTGADGTHVVRFAGSGAEAGTRIVATPPLSTGLPRFEAEVPSTPGIGFSYRASIPLRDVAGIRVLRGGQPVPNARVTIVGRQDDVGSFSGTTWTGTGYTRIPLVTDGDGELPSQLVLAGAYHAVIEVAAGDVAVSSLDLTGAVLPEAIEAPAPLPQTALALGPEPLEGVQLSLVPTGPLAEAGIPTIVRTSDATGLVAAWLASGGSYDLVWSDPAGRVGQRIDRDVTTLDASYELPRALRITGTLSVTGNPNRIQGAVVQILCADCTGLDRERPIAEGVSDPFGTFSIAVPDPGTM